MSYKRFDLRRFERQLNKFETMFDLSPEGIPCWRGRPEDEGLALDVLEALSCVYEDIYLTEEEKEANKDREASAAPTDEGTEIESGCDQQSQPAGPAIL